MAIPNVFDRISGHPGWWIAFAGSLAIALLAITPPVLGDGAREIVMAMFSGVCHQLPGRSPHVDGVQLAVCHRCMGIYWGVPAAALLFAASGGRFGAARNGAPFMLMAAALPAAFDWGLDVAGIWTNTPLTRGMTGAVFGLGAGWFLVLATSRSGSVKRGGNGVESDAGPGPEKSPEDRASTA